MTDIAGNLSTAERANRERFIAELAAEPPEHKAAMVRRYARLNRFAAMGQVVMAGSSLMEDFPIAELMPFTTDGHRIYNRGIGGFVSSEMIVAIEPLILDLAPSRLFLNIGSNDIASDTYRESQLLGNVSEILSLVRQRVPGCAIHLMAYYPVNAQDAFPGVDEAVRRALFAHRNNEAIQKANQAIAGLAAQAGCRFVDANAGLTDERGNLRRTFSIEGIHMHPDAYAVILDNLRPYL